MLLFYWFFRTFNYGIYQEAFKCYKAKNGDDTPIILNLWRSKKTYNKFNKGN